MWNLVKGAFQALFDLLWDAVAWILSAGWEYIILPVIEWGKSWLGILWTWVCVNYGGWLEDLWQVAQDLGFDWDKEGLIDAVDGLVGVYQGVEWFLPVTSCIVLWVNTLIICAHIRLARYVVGWIPMLEG